MKPSGLLARIMRGPTGTLIKVAELHVLERRARKRTTVLVN